MTISLDFFTTAGLSSAAASLSALQAADGTSAAVDLVVYLGSPDSGKKFRAQSNPGTDHIIVSINDAAIGTGPAATAVKLATSAGGLASAAAGAALSLGPQILSGIANAIPIYIRIDTPALAVGNYADLSLETNALQEEAV